MALRSIKPTIGVLRSTVSVPRDEHGHSIAAEPWRRWYKLARWVRLRWSVLTRDLFTCQWPGCGRLMADSSKLVADHKRPHRGDPKLFWDPENLWTLCDTCHSGAKQAEERRDARTG